jgi:hypothetical protein
MRPLTQIFGQLLLIVPVAVQVQPLTGIQDEGAETPRLAHHPVGAQCRDPGVERRRPDAPFRNIAARKRHQIDADVTVIEPVAGQAGGQEKRIGRVIGKARHGRSKLDIQLGEDLPVFQLMH